MNTNGVSGIAELLSKYGIPAVLLAVFLLLFMGMFNVFLKQINAMFQTFRKQNDVYFTTLVNPPSEPKILEDHLHINDMIGVQLRKLRDETDCDRTFIYMFHNSDHGIGGFPFLKASCFYEWSLSTVRPLLGKQRDIPVFLLADALKCLGKNKPCVISDILEMKTSSPALATYMEEVDSRSAILYPICSPSCGVVGFLGIDFTAVPISPDEADTYLRNVTDAAAIVQAMLDLRKGGHGNGGNNQDHSSGNRGTEVPAKRSLFSRWK